MIDLTIESFQPFVGRAFDIETLNGERLVLTLADVQPLPGDDDERRSRQPFTLIFRGADAHRMQQAVCRLTAHDAPEAVTDLFLVPIQGDVHGPRVQAVIA